MGHNLLEILNNATISSQCAFITIFVYFKCISAKFGVYIYIYIYICISVAHRSEYTPHIFVNILLYIFMGQH